MRIDERVPREDIVHFANAAAMFAEAMHPDGSGFAQDVFIPPSGRFYLALARLTEGAFAVVTIDIAVLAVSARLARRILLRSQVSDGAAREFKAAHRSAHVVAQGCVRQMGSRVWGRA